MRSIRNERHGYRPKVSIITAVRNGGDTIGQTIHSVRSQTYCDIEHIVIDGDSDDATLAILKGNLDPARSVLVSEPDDGIYDAMNKGLALATGDIVGILNSDDFYASATTLSDVVDAFADESLDGVYGDLRLISRTDDQRVLRYWRAGQYRKSSLAWGWAPPHQTLFLRRRIIERFGGFDLRYKIAADYDAMLRYLATGNIHIAYLPQTLVVMRAGGISNGSLAGVWRSTMEDYAILRRIGTGGLFALACKKLRKLAQFVTPCRDRHDATQVRNRTVG